MKTTIFTLTPLAFVIALLVCLALIEFFLPFFEKTDSKKVAIWNLRSALRALTYPVDQVCIHSKDAYCPYCNAKHTLSATSGWGDYPEEK